MLWGLCDGPTTVWLDEALASTFSANVTRAAAAALSSQMYCVMHRLQRIWRSGHSTWSLFRGYQGTEVCSRHLHKSALNMVTAVAEICICFGAYNSMLVRLLT